MNDKKIHLVDALNKKQFPPRIIYPDIENSDSLVELFHQPITVCVPEVENMNKKSFCIEEKCCCVPKGKEYTSRIVEDNNHKTKLLFIKYSCSLSGRVFSTIRND